MAKVLIVVFIFISVVVWITAFPVWSMYIEATDGRSRLAPRGRWAVDRLGGTSLCRHAITVSLDVFARTIWSRGQRISQRCSCSYWQARKAVTSEPIDRTSLSRHGDPCIRHWLNLYTNEWRSGQPQQYRLGFHISLNAIHYNAREIARCKWQLHHSLIIGFQIHVHSYTRTPTTPTHQFIPLCALFVFLVCRPGETCSDDAL